MGLSILHVAYPYAPVGPHAVGGAEQILGDLDRALVAAGHRSAVVACSGSQPIGELFSAPMPMGILDAPQNEGDRSLWQSRYQEAIDRALASRTVDLIHMHGLDWHRYRLPDDVPVLVTLHMPVAWYPEEIWQKRRRNVHFLCVSQNQLQGCPVPAVAMIENGVELPPWSPEQRRGEYALALGRICPEKNLHAALEAGTLANVPVHVGGQLFPYESHQRYDRECFQPALNANAQRPGPRHQFLGPLLPARKQRELARARCLLHPTLAPETSSLVAMEGLAAGTPVIAYRSGALPEMIQDGVTGFLVDSPASMADAIDHIRQIDPATCRADAERRFSSGRMCAEYFSLYAQIA